MNELRPRGQVWPLKLQYSVLTEGNYVHLWMEFSQNRLFRHKTRRTNRNNRLMINYQHLEF